MAIFNNMSITAKGQILYAKAQAGIELNFTKLQIGTGDIGTQNPATLIALINSKFDVGIQSITPNTELKTATIAGMISNANVTDATYICEIGLFAQDPDEGEILYGYGSAGKYGDYMAPASQGAYSWNYQINAAIGNAANVTVELSSLTYDYGVVNTNTTFAIISGGNQKEINKNIDTSLSDMDYQIAGGTATAIILNMQTLRSGYTKTFIASYSNSGSATTVNAKHLYKPNTTTAPNLIAGKAYTVWYNLASDCFFIKASAEGDALAANVLASKKFSNDYDTGLTGSMANNGALSTTLAINGNYAIPAGYTTGGTITQSIATKASNIYAPSTSNQVISAGQYLTGDQTIQATTGTASDEYVLAGKTYNSAAGIGRTGTATIESLGGRKYASGTVVSSAAKMTFNAAWTDTDTYYYVNITGLSFTPNIAVIQVPGTSLGGNVTSVNANHSYPINVVYNNGTSSSYTATFSSGTGCIISNGQLLVPVSSANTTYTYYIYE